MSDRARSSAASTAFLVGRSTAIGVDVRVVLAHGAPVTAPSPDG